MNQGTVYQHARQAHNNLPENYTSSCNYYSALQTTLQPLIFILTLHIKSSTVYVLFLILQYRLQPNRFCNTYCTLETTNCFVIFTSSKLFSCISFHLLPLCTLVLLSIFFCLLLQDHPALALLYFFLFSLVHTGLYSIVYSFFYFHALQIRQHCYGIYFLQETITCGEFFPL